MIRGMTGTILWSCLAGAIGVSLFWTKHEVKSLESQLAHINAEIQNDRDELHVLNAEWSYLNDPQRLQALAERYLGMHPVLPSQVATLDTLPDDLTVEGLSMKTRPAAPTPPVPLPRPGIARGGVPEPSLAASEPPYPSGEER